MTEDLGAIWSYTTAKDLHGFCKKTMRQDWSRVTFHLLALWQYLALSQQSFRIWVQNKGIGNWVSIPSLTGNTPRQKTSTNISILSTVQSIFACLEPRHKHTKTANPAIIYKHFVAQLIIWILWNHKGTETWDIVSQKGYRKTSASNKNWKIRTKDAE